jgi:type II secretory pathway component PulJ
MKRTGYSLIEVLLAIGLMAAILSLTSLMLFSVLRSARKSAAVAAAKTEGAYAMRAIERMVRYAGDISCPAGNLKVTLLNKDTITYGLAGGVISSNSAALTSDTLVINACTGGIFNCDISTAGKSVRICFVINKAAGTDVTDFADSNGTGGVTFQSQLPIRNFGN